MRERTLGRSDLSLSVVGFGSWAVGGTGYDFSWGPQDDDESVVAVRRALSLGVNWIDTAPVYGVGHSEEVVGAALRGLVHDVRRPEPAGRDHHAMPAFARHDTSNERPIIATKWGISWDEKGHLTRDVTKTSARGEVEASLRRLGVETIDLLQIHWPVPDGAIEKAWEQTLEVVEEGKVRHAGVSNFSVAQLERICRIRPPASLQPPYSMLVRGIEDEVLPFCAEHGIGVVVYSPLQKGILTGAWTKERAASLPATDHRRTNPWFTEPELSVNIELVDGLRRLAAKSGRSPSQLAIAWVLRRPEVTAAIVGTRKPAQIEDTAAAGDWVLSAGDIEAVDELLARREEALRTARR